jgi:hypothetical protein
MPYAPADLAHAEALFRTGDAQAAAQWAQTVLAHAPNDLDVVALLANAKREQGALGEALELYRTVLAQQPARHVVRGGYATALFYAGHWREAWRQYEVRHLLSADPPKVTRKGPDGSPVLVAPWRGGALPKRLLVLDEQGLGDTLQFCRFLPPLAQLGVDITFVTHRRLHGLLRTLGMPMTLRASDEPGSISGFEAWTPLASLPHALGLGPAQVERSQPYLSAEPLRVARWAKQIGTHGFKVGIVWQGSQDPRMDPTRSAPLAAFAPLAALPGVRLICLQTGAAMQELEGLPFADSIETLGDDFDSGPDGFLDCAAAMQQLDLVITVDTAAAHLAGALGIPVWILLKCRNTDWRWGQGQSDSLWYPSARLFRQPSPGDWGTLLRDVATAVAPRAVQSTTLEVLAPVSLGELLDKISILETKHARLEDEAKRANVLHELEALRAIDAAQSYDRAGLAMVIEALRRVNEALWDIEDAKRDCERRQDFGADFIFLARQVYLLNDERAGFKRRINLAAGSALVEEKSYAPYVAQPPIAAKPAKKRKKK